MGNQSKPFPHSVLEILESGKALLERLSFQSPEIAELVGKLIPLRPTRSLFRESNCSIEGYIAQSTPSSKPSSSAMNQKNIAGPSKIGVKKPKPEFLRMLQQPSLKAKTSTPKKYKQLVFDPSTMRLKSPQGSKKKTGNQKLSSAAAVYSKRHNPQFLVVQHIATSAIGFRCFIGQCQLQDIDEDVFRKHLKTEHPEVEWNSICTACCSDVGTKATRSILDELEHLLISHSDRDCLKNKEPLVITEELEDQTQIAATEVLDDKEDSPDEFDEFTKLFPEEASQELQPWIQASSTKSEAVTARMKKFECLVALFKCMESRCSFSTTSESDFAKHLKTHKGSDAGRTSCAYCTFKAANRKSLISHIKTDHRRDRFICRYCFYRSAAKENVFSHTMFYHLMEPTAFESESMHINVDFKRKLRRLTEKSDRKAIVPVLRCPLCTIPRSFKNIVDLEMHWKTNHEFATSFQCTKCKETVARESMSDHFETCLKVGTWQCVYCRFGSNVIIHFRMHLADKHPSKIPFVCVRKHCDTVSHRPAILKARNNSLISGWSGLLWKFPIAFCAGEHRR